jgi:hypothetical protein
MAPCRALLASLASLASLALPATARSAERVVLLPLENVARSPAGRAVVMKELELAFARRGYEVVGEAMVEDFLRKSRIRYLDSLPTAQVKALLAAMGADAVVLGTLLTYDGKRRDPEVALSLRLLGPNGATMWSAMGGLASSETVGAFKQGRVPTAEKLAQRLTADMLRSLPDGKVPLQRAAPPGRAGGGPRVHRSSELAGRDLKIVVLPLSNRTGSRTAARALEAVIQERLLEHRGVSLVSPADLRQAVVTTGLRAPSRLAAPQLARLGKELGTTLFLQGSILEYGTAWTETGETPAVEIYLSLLDAESGQTLWSGMHRRTGDDYQGLFRLGAVNAQSTLTSRAVAELLSAFLRD